MNNKELHYRYAISYLLLSIVLLLALAYYDVPNLVDKLNFALTLCSLLLSILAIFYTIISGHKQDNQFGKLLETNAELSNAASEIKTASREVNNLVRDVPIHFDSIGKRLDHLSIRYSSARSEQPILPPNNNVDRSKTELKIDTIQFQAMIGRIPYSGMAVLYLFLRAWGTNKPIEFGLFKSLEICEIDFALGILYGIRSTGLIELRLHKGAIIASACNPIVEEHLPPALKSVISVVSQDTGKMLSAYIEKIDSNFNAS